MESNNIISNEWQGEVANLLPHMNEKTKKILRWLAVSCGLIATLIIFVLTKASNDKRTTNNIDGATDGPDGASN